MDSTVSEDPPAHLPRWAVAADLLAALFFLAGTYAIATGGGFFYIGGVKLSMHSAARPYFWALAITAVRFYFVRQPHPLISRIVGDLPPTPFEEHQLFAPPAGVWPRVRELLLLTAGYSVLVAIATWPMVAQPYAVSDLGDPLFSIWRLMWITHEFPNDPLNVFNGNQMYPEVRTLTFSDPVLFSALLFAPLYALGLHPIVAYNIVFLSGGVFSGVTLFLLVRALTGRADAAVIAGAIFAVYPYRGEHLAHLELQMTLWFPIAIWYVHRTMARGRVRDGLAAGAAIAAQFFSSLYYGAFLLTYALVVGGVLWLARDRPWPPVRALAAGGLLAAVLFSPVAFAYLQTRSHMGDRLVGEVSYYSAVGPDYLKAHYRSLTYHSLAEDAAPERSLFPRVTPVLLALIALWPPLSVSRIAYLLALAFSVEVSLGMHGSIFPWLYHYGPPYSGIRVPARYSVLVGMSLAILAGYGAARCFRRWPRARGVLLAAILVAIAVEALPRIELVPLWRQPPPIYAPLASGPPAVLAEFPTPDEDGNVHPFAEFIYLYFSTFHWQTLVNGQSGWLPPSYQEFVARVRTFPSDEAVAYLRRRGVQYITIHGAFYPPERRAGVLAGVDARADLERVAQAEWEGSESRLYRLR